MTIIRILLIFAVVISMSASKVHSAEAAIEGLWKNEAAASPDEGGVAHPEGRYAYDMRSDGTYTRYVGPWVMEKGTYVVEDGRLVLTSDIGIKTLGWVDRQGLEFNDKFTGTRVKYSRFKD